MMVALEPANETSRPSLQHTSLTAGAALAISLIVFSIAGVASAWLGYGTPHLGGYGFSGFTIPDAISLESSVHQAWTSGWAVIPHILTFVGTVLLYYPTTLIGGTYSLFINVLLLSAASVLFRSVIIKIGCSDSVGRTWIIALGIVSTNMYLIICMGYPNKEIPLIFLTTVFIFGIVHEKWHLLFISVFVSYWFRDGYALILCMITLVVLCRRFTFASGGILSVSFFAIVLIAFPIQDMSAVDPALQRNVRIGSIIAGDKFSVLGDVAGYGARLVGNALNLGLRPQIVDVNGGIHLLGLGYWQFGIVLLAGLIWGVCNVLSRDIARGCVALVILTSLLGISYSTFVQPRYMMPLMFLLTLGLSKSRLGRYAVLPASIICPLVFLSLGVLPPLAEI